jgi:2-C-methyl-D-erythritol 4-phosphate cytidylyltransferase
MNPELRAWAVIPAAGSGSRLQADRPKQYLPLLGRAVIARTVDLFLQDQRFAGVVIALSANDPYFAQAGLDPSPRLRTTIGGDTRQRSVLAALRALPAMASDWVFVHDAARPCLTSHDLNSLFATLGDDVAGALLGAPVADTLKRVEAQQVKQTVDRQSLWRAFTPQVGRYGDLLNALSNAESAGLSFTDDVSALEHGGHRVVMVRGRDDNLKITQGQDMVLAEQILLLQQQQGLRQ